MSVADSSECRAESEEAGESSIAAEARRLLARHKAREAHALLLSSLEEGRCSADEEMLLSKSAAHVKCLERVLAELDAGADRWSPLVSRGGIVVHTRIPSPEEASIAPSMVGARLEATLDCSALEALACIFEADLYTSWMPFAERVDLLASSSEAVCMRVCAGGFPWPLRAIFSRREVLAVGFGYDLLSTPRRSVVLAVSDFVDAEGLCGAAAPEPVPGAVRVDLGVCGAEIRPLAKDRCTMVILGGIDPKVPLLPAWAFSLAVRLIAGRVFAALCAACANPENRRRVRTRPEMYIPAIEGLTSLGLCPEWVNGHN